MAATSVSHLNIAQLLQKAGNPARKPWFCFHTEEYKIRAIVSCFLCRQLTQFQRPSDKMLVQRPSDRTTPLPQHENSVLGCHQLMAWRPERRKPSMTLSLKSQIATRLEAIAQRPFHLCGIVVEEIHNALLRMGHHLNDMKTNRAFRPYTSLTAQYSV